MQLHRGYGSVYIGNIGGVKIVLYEWQSYRLLKNHIRYEKLHPNKIRLEDTEIDISIDSDEKSV